MASALTPLHFIATVRQSPVIPLGDRALTIDMPDLDGVVARDRIRCLLARIRRDAPAGVTGIVPALRSITLHYEPWCVSFDALSRYLADALATLVIAPELPRESIVIPVCYGDLFGPDLDDVATAHGMTPDAIVALHTAAAYTVAMIGFLPGFPYLDGLPAALHTPRRATPRTTVPAGSVGIGGGSTGVYPFVSPGGWHLIGRTPRVLFSARRNPPSLLSAGDTVRFASITADAFRASSGETLPADTPSDDERFSAIVSADRTSAPT